jgi:transaldolase
MNPIDEVRRYGQSLWLDYISRGMIRSGELKRLIEQAGITGLTSNPTLFERAIDETHDYDEALRHLDADPHFDSRSLYESFSVEDVRAAADALRPVYERTGGADGYASIEVSPYLAHDSHGTVAEASRLWHELDRPNVMVKIPATREGVPAIDPGETTRVCGRMPGRMPPGCLPRCCQRGSQACWSALHASS